MKIIFWNCWPQKEFVMINLSWRDEKQRQLFSIGILGFGVTIIIFNKKVK